jgi:hypothetical protein
MLHSMSSTLRQRTALLLIALLVMLPLQSVLAAWHAAGSGDHCSHAAGMASPADHSSHARHGDCCKTASPAQATADKSSPCEGGCDHCTTVSAAVISAPCAAQLDDPERAPRLLTDSGQPLDKASALLRPPQASL